MPTWRRRTVTSLTREPPIARTTFRGGPHVSVPDDEMTCHLGAAIIGTQSAASFRATVIRLREQGVSRLFIADDTDGQEAFQLAAIASQMVPGMELNIAVTNPFLRSPGALAEAALSLHEVARGSIVLGLGSSSQSIITEQLGLDYGNPRRLILEVVREVRRICNAEDPALEIPLLLAAMGPKMLHLAGQIADRVVLNVGTTSAYVRWARERLANGAAEVGRNAGEIDLAVWVAAYIGDDIGEAMKRASRFVARMLAEPYQGELILKFAGCNDFPLDELRASIHSYPHNGDLDVAARLVPEDIVRRLAVIGSPKDLRNSVADFLHAGAQTVVLSPHSMRSLCS